MAFHSSDKQIRPKKGKKTSGVRTPRLMPSKALQTPTTPRLGMANAPSPTCPMATLVLTLPALFPPSSSATRPRSKKKKWDNLYIRLPCSGNYSVPSRCVLPQNPAYYFTLCHHDSSKLRTLAYYRFNATSRFARSVHIANVHRRNYVLDQTHAAPVALRAASAKNTTC